MIIFLIFIVLCFLVFDAIQGFLVNLFDVVDWPSSPLSIQAPVFI